MRLACAALLLPLAPAETLDVRLRNGELHFSTTRLDLIRGTLAERLRAGGTVSFDFHLTLWAGTRTSLRRRGFERFTISYDLWEEKFSVANLRRPNTAAARLDAAAIGPWCVRNLALGPVDLAADRQLWARLDIKAVDPKDPALQDEALSLNAVIERLSRPTHSDSPRWTLESGALNWKDLRP